MSWFWFALAAPAIFAISNLIDRYLLLRGANADAHETKEKSFAALIIYSTAFSILVPFVMLLLGVDPFDGMTTRGILTLLLNGVISVSGLWLYLKALEKEHASVVVPLFQLIPVFTLTLGYMFLGETLTYLQVIGFIVILAGAFLISLDFEDVGSRKFKIKTGILLLMLAANITLAVNSIIYKAIVIDSPFYPTMFWEYLGCVLFGVIAVVTMKSYREEAVSIVKKRHWKMISVNGFNEAMYVIATFCFRFAAIAVPVALVNVVNGFQPVFILIFGWLFTRFVPSFVTEDITRRNMIQKSIAIIIIVAGGVLLNVNDVL